VDVDNRGHDFFLGMGATGWRGLYRRRAVVAIIPLPIRKVYYGCGTHRHRGG
jgi:hypothetical protein